MHNIPRVMWQNDCEDLVAMAKYCDLSEKIIFLDEREAARPGYILEMKNISEVETVMRGPRGIRSGQHFSLWSHEAGFSSWRARSAAISCRSPPQLWSGDKKYASSASSREYILFDGLAPRLSHVSHVIPEPEPESRYGHANYGPGERGLQRAARQGRSYEQHGITLALCLWY